jgi:hypothetical protein
VTLPCACVLFGRPIRCLPIPSSSPASPFVLCDPAPLSADLQGPGPVGAWIILSREDFLTGGRRNEGWRPHCLQVANIVEGLRGNIIVEFLVMEPDEELIPAKITWTISRSASATTTDFALSVPLVGKDSWGRASPAMSLNSSSCWAGSTSTGRSAVLMPDTVPCVVA